MNVDELIIDEHITMVEAMKIIDKTGKKVVFVADDGKLVASLTDGDIRRWILRKGNLEAEARDIANYNPKFLYERDKSSAKAYMKKHSIGALPIVDDDKRIISIVMWNDSEINGTEKLNVPVVIMAGGFGTRLYPYTKVLPKPLIPIGDLPITEHIINRLWSYGCTDFYLILNHKGNMVKAYFNEIEKEYKITYVDERKPLGTGGGLSLLKGKIKESFILTNCDVIIDDNYSRLVEFHKSEGNLITMVCSLKNIEIPYGIIEIDENGSIENMKEKPQLSFFTNTGFYIVEPKVIDEMRENECIDFPDIIQLYRSRGEKVGVYPISEHAWMDMGQFDTMEEMKKRLNCHG